MEDKFISLEEVTKGLQEIENAGMSLSRNFSLLSQKLKYIFSKIKLCETIEHANGYFDILENIQSVLAKLVFNEDIGIPERLMRFVSDFDNLEFYKDYYFTKIKKGEYNF